MNRIGLVIAINVFVGLFAAVPAHAGTLSATPQSGYATETIQVTGTGFSVLGVCSLHFVLPEKGGVPSPANLLFGKCTPEPDGSLTGSFVVPAVHPVNMPAGGYTLRACNGPTLYTCTETGDTSFTLLAGQAVTTTAPSTTTTITTTTTTTTILQTTTTQAASTGPVESEPPATESTPTEVATSPQGSVPCPDPPAGGAATSTSGGGLPPSAVFGMGGLLALNVVTLSATNTAVGESMRRWGSSVKGAISNMKG